MQNKGFIVTFAILLSLVCAYYLSFSFVTRKYDQKAVEYATEYADAHAEVNTELHDQLYNQEYYGYLDSMSTERVWLNFGSDSLGYTLKECREKEIGLGLDLKGGMSVIVEVDAGAVLLSLGDEDNAAFMTAIKEASVENRVSGTRDYITTFVDKFQSTNGKDKLAGIFSSKLKDQIKPTDNDSKVITVLKAELESVAENSFNVLRTRIDRYGVVAPNIQKLDNRAERIMIELPGIKEPDRVRKLLQGSANLEFWKTYNPDEIYGFIEDADRLSAADLAVAKGLKTDSTVTASDSLKVPVELGFEKSLKAYFAGGSMGGATIGLVNKIDTAAVNRILYKYKDVANFPSALKFGWGFKAEDSKESLFALYCLKGDGPKKGAALDGESVISAKAEQGQHGTAWVVGMSMNSTGTQHWAAITGSEIGKSIAIVLDGAVYSAPNVNNKIENGSSQITGKFTAEDAKDLENVLKSGKMKAGVRIVQEDVVGPSLGQEAISAGIISFLLALVVLMTYMCLVYGLTPGMVANTALLLNMFFTLGVLSAFGAVMTLPGITGLVLTLAMAIDANVLIYERTREELRAGKNVQTALMDGYKHAFSAIFDANMAHIIACIILIYFGTGAVKGFATTLMIGVIASFFTAIFMTRMFYDVMLTKGYFRNLTFTTVISKNLFVNTKINFLGMTKKAYFVSIAIIIAGLLSLFVFNGLYKGIDFTGGRNYLVRFETMVNANDVEKALIPEFEGSMVHVLTSGSASQSATSSQVRITTNYKTDDSSDAVDAEIKGKMTNALKSFLPEGATIEQYVQSSQHVGPSVADDLKTSATIAVILSVVCMALYILLRFRDLAFSVGTLIAVAHDALMVILLYSLLYKIMPFSMEIDQAFIAAVLTVIGYSINDKVVIFDRIRELRNLYPKRDVTLSINEALNSTLGRTINTSLSSVLVVLCIFILGGDTIRSFTFAMLIGIIIGTYSSVFVATPIAWQMLKKKQVEGEPIEKK